MTVSRRDFFKFVGVAGAAAAMPRGLLKPSGVYSISDVPYQFSLEEQDYGHMMMLGLAFLVGGQQYRIGASFPKRAAIDHGYEETLAAGRLALLEKANEIISGKKNSLLRWNDDDQVR